MNPANIVSTADMISARNPSNQAAVDQVLTVGRDMVDEYGDLGVLGGAYEIAELKGMDAVTTLAYFDGNNIAVNQNFMDTQKMNNAMKEAAKSGHHPPLGNKTGLEAVAAHEYGHALANAVGQKLGLKGNTIDAASTKIVHEAMKEAGHKNSKSLAQAISGYAATNYAETVAEAVGDVYCNGSKAKKESIAVVKVINKYLKG